jgi:hypothetical protein
MERRTALKRAKQTEDSSRCLTRVGGCACCGGDLVMADTGEFTCQDCGRARGPVRSIRRPDVWSLVRRKESPAFAGSFEKGGPTAA